MAMTLKTLMRLKLQRRAAAAAAVAARAPSLQANDSRMERHRWKRRIRSRRKEIKTLDVLSLQHGVVALPGRCIIIAFVSCINMWCL